MKRGKLFEGLAFLVVAIGTLPLPGQQNATKAAPVAAPATGSREVVSGIGGLFFRAHDPKMMAQWYQQHLGVGSSPTSKDQQPWKQDAGPTAFQPFSEKSSYFEADKQWMLDFRVRNLDGLVTQLQAEGIEVKVDPVSYPYGRFARLHDPEGNSIELWQPAEANSQTK